MITKAIIPVAGWGREDCRLQKIIEKINVASWE